MSEKILRVSRKLVQKKKGFFAIRYLYHGIQLDPENVELYICLGDALKQSIEFDLALKIYRKALYLARTQGKDDLLKIIDSKIESVYVLSPSDAPAGPQIGFFIRSLMKMLNTLGKKDWF